MSATAKARHTPRGTSPTAPAQKSAANCGRIAVDRVQLAASFRSIARQSAEAARLIQQIADAANGVAAKLESLPAATTSQPAKKASVQNA